MTTAYSTLVCNTCGTTFPATQGKCVKCKPITEERVRELAMSAAVEWLPEHRVREIAAEVFAEGHAASVKRLMSEKDALAEARASALEEAAAMLEERKTMLKTESAARMVRELKTGALKSEKARDYVEAMERDQSGWAAECCRLRRWLEWRKYQLPLEGWINDALAGKDAPKK